MRKTSRILVAGHRGLVGSALVRRLACERYEQVVVGSREEFDASDAESARVFFERERPEYVFLAAACVGGIKASFRRPAEFMQPNLAIAAATLRAACEAGVERLLFFACSCIYPASAPQPIAETSLLTGPFEGTSELYALAKLAGVKLCEAYNRQHGTRFLSVCPPTLYGVNDNFDVESAHVISALIRRFDAAVAARRPERVAVWGSGCPRREFLYADDLASACLFLMDLDDLTYTSLVERPASLLNVGPGDEIPIRDLALLIASIVGFEGEVAFDASMPDGAGRKLLDCTAMQRLGWKPETPLDEGLRRTYEWYRAEAPSRIAR